MALVVFCFGGGQWVGTGSQVLREGLSWYEAGMAADIETSQVAAEMAFHPQPHNESMITVPGSIEKELINYMELRKQARKKKTEKPKQPRTNDLSVASAGRKEGCFHKRPEHD